MSSRVMTSDERSKKRWMLTYALVFAQSDETESNGKHASVDRQCDSFGSVLEL